MLKLLGNVPGQADAFFCSRTFKKIPALVGGNFAQPAFGVLAVKFAYVPVSGQKSLLCQVLGIKVIPYKGIANGEDQPPIFFYVACKSFLLYFYSPSFITTLYITEINSKTLQAN